MSPDYQASVVAAYERKRKNHDLSPNLKALTPAKFRDESLLIYRERYEEKDAHLLRSFFEPQGTCEEAIKDVDIDKFRPLIKFIKDQKIKTNPLNLELLAWLIGFEPRPYREANSYPPPKPLKTKKNSYALIVLALALTGAGSYYWKSRSAEGCMVWAHDHYRSNPCIPARDGEPLIVPADTFLLAHFKKINRPDTLTGRSLGKVWLIQLNGELEYYTTYGPHPVNPERHLRPLSQYMLNKYIRHL